MRRLARLLPVAALAALSACQLLASEDDNRSLYCPAVLVPSVVVEIRDSLSGAPRAAGATGWATTGTHRDSLRRYQMTDGVLVARQGYGPAGRYEVTVEHPGYRTWRRSGIDVPDIPCGPGTAKLTARLVPL